MSKTKTIAFRVTPDEHKEISKRAKKQGIKISELCRNAAINKYTIMITEKFIKSLKSK